MAAVKELPSRPVRARGLKLNVTGTDTLASVVAPRAGAWIETRKPGPLPRHWPRRAPCGRVD